METEFLTIDELAKELKVKKSWIYARTRKGQVGIPHIRFGGNLRFERKKVVEFFTGEIHGLQEPSAGARKRA